jgi:peptidoglycan/xylan/chitin deacetylase (PgdA/CDA1 family)
MEAEDDLCAAGTTAAARVDPQLAAKMDLRSWFESGWRRRLIRRLLAHLPQLATAFAARLGGRAHRLAVEGTFWGGVRRVATDAQWRRLTMSSYVVLYYHRLQGDLKPGQERLDVPPDLFERQLRLLRRLRFHALSPDELVAFHDGLLPTLPRRSFVVTADDGFRDCVEPFIRHASIHPQFYVSSAEVGGRSWWAGDEPLVDWDDLRRMARAGVSIGSHAHRHIALPELDDSAIRADLSASRRVLVAGLPATVPLLAYPYGRRDARVEAAARAAGFQLAFTTEPGRNGAGTDAMHLRRVGVKAWDSRSSFLWKALTGELLAPRWEARLIRRGPPGSRRPRPTPGPDDV